MGRRASGYKVRWRGPARGYYVRFTIGAERADIPTGIKDKRQREAADREGRSIFAQAVTGRKQSRRSASATALAELVDTWLSELPTRGPTRKQYENYTTAHWLTRWSTPRDLTAPNFDTYARQRLRKVRGKTVRNELSALRQFVKWLVAHGHLSESPVFPEVKASVTGTPHPVRRRTRAPELTREEVDAVIAKLPLHPKRGTWAVRDRARFAYETGLRPTTLEKLRTPDNYRRGAPELILTDEDDKEMYGRTVPLSDAARAAIDRVCPKKTGPIFGRHRLMVYVHEAAQKALTPDKARIFSAQHFRSARATHWLDDGAAITGVQYLLGHKHTSTTARYVRPSLAAARKVIAGS